LALIKEEKREDDIAPPQQEFADATEYVNLP
jgi:hypothetical protein